MFLIVRYGENKVNPLKLAKFYFSGYTMASIVDKDDKSNE